MDTKKQAICEALYRWVNQRPGLEFGNYGDVTAYRAEMRSITRQRRDALTLLRAVELRDSISGDDLEAAFPRAFSGRLSVQYFKAGEPKQVAGQPVHNACYPTDTAVLDYCAGQYWPTEYRAAAASVLAYCFWDWMRDGCMPAAIVKDGQKFYPHSLGSQNVISAGDWLRAKFRREFGATMQRRYFD